MNLKSILSNRPAKLFLLLATAAIFIFLYTVNLQTIPTSVHGDEGETALQALEILKGRVDIIGVGWYDLPLLSFVPHAITIAIFGENIIGNRLGSVIFGFLTVPIFYLFINELFKTRVAFISTLLLATSHMWIALSRLGITYVQATFLMLAALYFLFKALRTQKLRYFIFTGIFLGLSFYSYYAVRILPFIMVLPIFHYFLKSGITKKTLLQIGILIISAIVIFSPQGLFYLKNPNTFSSRTNSVFIFSSSGKQWTNYNKSDPEIFLEQTKRTFNIFAGDNSTQYGYKGQLIEYITLTFFLVGAIYVLRYFFQKSLLLFTWLILALLGQILTTMPTPIFLPRFVIGLPVFFIFSALGFDVLYKITKRYNLKYILVLTILLIIFYNLRIYFIEYPKQLETGIAGGGFHELTPMKIAKYLTALPNDYKAIFLTAPYLSGDYGSLKFLISQKERITINNPYMFATNQGSKAVLGTQTENLGNSTRLVFIIYPEYQSELINLKKAYPYGQRTEFYNGNGQLELIIYTVGDR